MQQTWPPFETEIMPPPREGGAMTVPTESMACRAIRITTIAVALAMSTYQVVTAAMVMCVITRVTTT